MGCTGCNKDMILTVYLQKKKKKLCASLHLPYINEICIEKAKCSPPPLKKRCISEVTTYLFFSVYDDIFRKKDWLYSLPQNFLITRCSFETRVLLTGTRSIWPAVRIDLAQ